MSNGVPDNQLHPIGWPVMSHTYMAILYEVTRPKKVFVFSNGKKT